MLLEGTVQGLFLKRPAEALECYDNILLLYPDSSSAADAMFQKGIIFYGQRRFDSARNAFSVYSEKFPHGLRRASAEAWLKSIASKENGFPIRVLVADHAQQLSFRSAKTIIVQDAATERCVGSGASTLSITIQRGGLSIDGRRVSYRQVRISSKTDMLTLNGRRSRGEYLVSVTDDGLQAANHIPLEQYLYGIIPQEMPYTWPEAALKAQAVASRTYALYIREQNRNSSYDVSASIASQVYGGVDAERPPTNLAVDATRGQVMTFGSSLIAAYFHADSGGHTEDARNVWDVDIPYLRGVPDRFSGNAPGSKWQCYLPFDLIADRLRQAGMSLGTVRRVSILKKSPTGRVLKIQVVSDKGVAEMSGNHFRVNMGPMNIKSTCFQLTSKTAGVFLNGKGYGHGVGMSQQGASRMAVTGFTYRQILEYYYPGITIADAAVVCRNS